MSLSTTAISRKFLVAPFVLAVGDVHPSRRSSAPPRLRSRRAASRRAGTGCRRHDARSTTRSELAVTVYNSDIALVRDVRNLQIARGTSDLHFMDIAATVNPATVHFRSLTEPSRVSVLEQNYEYDLLEPDKLLRKYVGRDVTLVRTRQDRQHDARGGREGAPAQLQQRARLADRRRDRHRHAAPITSGFRSCRAISTRGPTLIWTLDNTGGTRHRVEASYLAGKLSWNADYVLTVARDDKTADIDGWVTVVNGSGTSFRNATLQLVAGDLNRVRQVIGRMAAESMREGRGGGGRAAMAQEAFSDYHLYTLGRKTTVNNSETKQVSMLGATAFPVQKRYVVDGQAFYYRNAQHPGAPIKDVVQVYYQFKNDEKAGLGMPMPAGTVRVYQADSKGGVQFVGEDRIDHTPKDEAHQPQDRQRVRRRVRAQADRLPEDRRQRLRGRVRDHAAQPQGRRR